jgi:predicted small lipoprotein YifL
MTTTEEAVPKLDAPSRKGPRALPPAKKAKPGKTKPNKTKPRSKIEKPKPPAKAKRTAEIDPGSLDHDKARKRLRKIYALEKDVERCQAVFDSASTQRRAAKADLEAAQEALELEIREQRFGPGPLFNTDGSGPAGTPQDSKLNPEP